MDWSTTRSLTNCIYFYDNQQGAGLHDINNIIGSDIYCVNIAISLSVLNDGLGTDYCNKVLAAMQQPVVQLELPMYQAWPSVSSG